jgi:hypothetical protein
VGGGNAAVNQGRNRVNCQVQLQEGRHGKGSQASILSTKSRNTPLIDMKTRIIVMFAMLVISGQSEAWIAYGFKSGMSRFDVLRYLSEKESVVVTENAQQTLAGPDGDNTSYNLIYCSTPQKLYLMKFRLGDSHAAFEKTKEKYERRYGKPESSGQVSDERENENWQAVDVSLIWLINESETILLTHGNNGTIAEFQDISVCK